MEGNPIRWAEFQVINLMGVQDLQLKLTAFLAAHLVIDCQSQGLIMVTNLFQKELKSNLVECSSALSCLGTISNRDLLEQLLPFIIPITIHSKPIIRKKAIALLTKCFLFSPHSIPGNLEKVLAQLNKETNTAVLAAGVGLLNATMRVAPSLYPLFLPLVYDQISKQRSNWLLIKLVRLANKLIEREPRLQGKLVEHYTRLLNQTGSKSLQYELVYSVMYHFKGHQTLYESAGDVLRQFLNHPDANLRSLGLECLTNIQTAAGLQEFQDQILESFKKGDYFYKIQILALFKEFTTSQNFSQVIEFFLKNLDAECNHKIIDTLLWIIQKDKFINVDDPQKLLLQYLPVIAIRIDNNQDALKFRDVIVDLLARVTDLRPYSDQLAYQILGQFQTKSSTNQGATLNIVQRHTQLKYQLNHREIIFKTLLMLTGESTQNMDLQSLIKFVTFLENCAIIQQYESSLPDLDSLLFKIATQIALKMEPFDQEKFQNEVMSKVNSVYIELARISIVKGQLFYQSLLNSQDVRSLATLYSESLPPINLEAQKLVKRPTDLDLEQPFQIDPAEIELMKATRDDPKPEPVQQVLLEQEQKSDSAQESGQQNQENNRQGDECEMQPTQPQRTFQINREEALPPGVTQSDLQRLKDESD